MRAILMLRLSAVAFLASFAAAASEQTIKIENAWARATVPGQTTAGVYLDLTSSTDSRLVAASSPLAQKVEMHSMTVSGGVMRMRPLSRIELPAGQKVTLAPNVSHLMLVGLKEPLKTGQKVPLVLSLEPAGSSPSAVRIEAEVRGYAAPPTGHSH